MILGKKHIGFWNIVFVAILAFVYLADAANLDDLFLKNTVVHSEDEYDINSYLPVACIQPSNPNLKINEISKEKLKHVNIIFDQDSPALDLPISIQEKYDKIIFQDLFSFKSLDFATPPLYILNQSIII